MINFLELNHAARVSLASEIHSRPFLKLAAPELVTHLAIYAEAEDALRGGCLPAQHALLASLCAHFGVASAALDAKYFYYDFGSFRLKWECHAEFATYTFARAFQESLDSGVDFEACIAHMPIKEIPETWLRQLQGKILVAAHVILERSKSSHEALAQQLQSLFKTHTLAGSRVMQGGEFWSDFMIHADGFSRFLVRDLGMRSQQAGRLVQRILEIETYRMMALLGLPYAQRATSHLNAIENELAQLAAKMVDADFALREQDFDSDGASDRELLEQITRLAARMEKLSLENNYRFSASQAYFGLVHARIDELREVRLEGVPMLVEFMDRRLTPAMNTCNAMANRQDALARRIAHSNELLSTRVGIVQEAQNRKILQSMNNRADHQLRLQQAVEGLSVVAISYYAVGLFGYLSKGAKDLGWIAHADSVIGAFVPIVLGAVWLGLRHLHRKMRR